MKRKNNITGVILAGGKNSRMGKEKGLIHVDGKRIIERIIQELELLVNQVIIISNGDNYSFTGLKIYSDIIPGCGPIGGIFTALSFTNTEKNLIVACDMPFVNKNIFQMLIDNTSDEEITVPEVLGEIHPLCAIYSTAVRNGFSKLIEKGNWKLKDTIKKFAVNQLNIPAEIFGTEWCMNINTPADLEMLNK